MSLFYGLEIAKTGLAISQKQLEVTGHNISNANTDGYTRQRIITSSVEAQINGRFMTIAKGAVGAGVEVQTLEQVRNAYLDKQYRQENAGSGYWSTRTSELDYVASQFGSTANNTIASALSGFYDSLSQFTIDPTSTELRTNVQQKAITLTDTFNQYYEQLAEAQSNENENMKTTVDTINQKLNEIAEYNKEISNYELAGEKANDLRDKRNLALDTLSGLVNIDYSENSDGTLNVSVEGQTLVDNATVNELTMAADQTGVVTGQTGFYSISYKGAAFKYSSGKLDAYRDLRDGNSADDVGIPRIIDDLNTLARGITKEFNAVNSAGYTMATSSTASKTGVNFFAVPSGGLNDVTAGNLKLSSDILSDVNNIAASDTKIDLSASNTQASNNKNAAKLEALCTATNLDTIGGFDTYLKSTISELAITAAHSETMGDSQDNILSSISDQRDAVTSVSIDEEMISMLKYQHAYAAASRMITAIDEALNTLISSTGVVGR